MGTRGRATGANGRVVGDNARVVEADGRVVAAKGRMAGSNGREMWAGGRVLGADGRVTGAGGGGSQELMAGSLGRLDLHFPDSMMTASDPISLLIITAWFCWIAAKQSFRSISTSGSTAK